MQNVELIFVTKNANKIKEANAALSALGIKLKAPDFEVEKLEVQDDRVENISLFAAKHAYEAIKEPFVVEDDGLFVDELNGFPGPYTAYAYKTIGIEGVLKLLEGRNNRKAYFISAVTLQVDGKFYLFTKKVEGEISNAPRGKEGFGFDPIFIPKGQSKTYAEMELDEKSKISHRAGAFLQMANFFVNYYLKQKSWVPP